MPRITKASRTSLPVKSTTYNLNEEFRDYASGNLYTGKDRLILWSDYCDPELGTVVPNHDVVGKNMSTLPEENILIYSPMGTGVKSRRLVDKTNFCGEKCIFYAAAIRDTAPGGGFRYNSGQSLLLQDSNILSFTEASSDPSNGFTVSFWIYPRKIENDPASSFDINEGGRDGSGKILPTFFNKEGEYHLGIDTDGRLRLSLYTDDNNYIYGESTQDAFLHNVWNNIVVRHKGDMSEGSIEIFRNGQNITDPSRATEVGTYTGMVNQASNFTFGVGKAKMSSMPSSFSAKSGPLVFFAELAIWNSFLTDDSIKAVHGATLSCKIEDFAMESGYTNNPPRVRLKILDSMTGSYPTIKRSGNRDFRGDYPIKFNDLSTLIFGEKIVDEFAELEPRETRTRKINKSNWEYSYGMEIRRESLSGFNGSTFEDGVLVFTGPLTRFIKTKRRVRNAIIEYELVQGPHNLATNIIGEGLQLEQGSIDEKLKVQFTTDVNGATGWQDLAVHTPSTLISFYQNSQNLNRRRIKKRIHFRDIPSGDSDYFIRFVQENHATVWKSVWGIGRIEILSMNQNVTYPLLIDHDDVAGKNASSFAIATPHTRSDLKTVGRTLPGTSDNFIHFTPGENLSPFKENYAVEDLNSDNLFHAIGSDPSTGAQNMSFRLGDKTKFTIEINSNAGATIGQTDYAPAEARPDEAPSSVVTVKPNSSALFSAGKYEYQHDLMCLYDNETKSWVTKGMPGTVHSSHDLETFIQDHAHLAFGPTDIIATRSAGAGVDNSTIDEQYDKDVLSNYVRPIKTFGFPFSNKYELSSKKAIKVSDFIDKPFIVEKFILDFKASFEFAKHNSVGNGSNTLGLHQSFYNSNPDPDHKSSRFAAGHKVIIPSFFVLNQFQGAYRTNEIHALKRGTDSPTVANKVSLQYSSDLKSREMISYGQMTLFMSNSNGRDLDLETSLDQGLKRDLTLNVLEITNQEGQNLDQQSVNSFTGSFKLEFPCRVSPKTDFIQRLQMRSGSNSDPSVPASFSLWMNDPSGGRNYEGLERGNRGLINNFPGLKKGKSYKTFSNFLTQDPIEVTSVSQDTVDQYSPYTIVPGDELILGWQYPPHISYSTTGNNSLDVRRNIMNLIGDAKLHIYGSFLSDRKEKHEYSNQPLTSNAVHELISGDDLVDQYQIQTRQELSGSYIDDWIYSSKFGERWVNSAFGLPDVYIFSDVGNKRLDRIGKPKISIANFENESQTTLQIWHSGITSLAQRASAILFSQNRLQPALGEKDQIQRFAKMKNKDNFYNDSVAAKGKFFTDSSYGTLQTFYKAETILGYSTTDDSQSFTSDGFLRKIASPKYYFNYRHFGHSFDFYDQGRDSKLWTYTGLVQDAPESANPVDEYDISKSTIPPVVTKWVTSSLVNDFRIRIYNLSSYNDLFGTVTNPNLKPYNSNIHSTSSKPYFDNERTEIFFD